MKKENNNKINKSKFKLINGNPNLKSIPKSKIKKSIENNDNLYIKAAVVGSKFPDIMPLFPEENKTDKILVAIEEFKKLVKESPDDLTIVNTLGDLFVRVGKTEEAVYYFSIIGSKLYSEGNFLKALAIFKKINKLEPSNKLTLETLKEIYLKLGFMVDAKKIDELLKKEL